MYCSNTPWNLILGLDFLGKYRVKIDFGLQCLLIPNKINVFTNFTCQIPPFSEKSVSCNLGIQLDSQIVGLVTASQTLLGLNLNFLETFTSLSQDCTNIHLQIANPTSNTVNLNQGMNIAYLELFNGQDTIEPLLENDDGALLHPNSSVRCIGHTCNISNKTRQNPSTFSNHISPFILSAFPLTDSKLTETEKQKLYTLLSDYEDVFHHPGQALGATDVLKHKITLKRGSEPFRSTPYRMSPDNKKEVAKQLKEMLDQGICRESNSPYSSPVLLVNKADGTKRFCVDMRRLNDMTIKDSFPLIRIDDALDTLGGSKYFATLDLQSGFWQIMLEEDSKPYTAFITYDNLYEFERMPFGLCNSPATFARLMMRILRDLVWKKCLIYLDDIVIFAPSFDSYLERISLDLDRLRKANLKVKPKKCVFGMPKINFLGHIVSEEGLSTDPAKCLAVKNFPVPKTLKSLRSFLGMTNYYSKFVDKYREIASPLYKLTRKNVPFIWTEKCQQAFERLKDGLQNAPVLGYPDFNETVF